MRPLGLGSGDGERRDLSVRAPTGLDAEPGIAPAVDELFFPALAQWQPVLQRLGISPRSAHRAAMRAEVHGSDIATELLALGVTRREELSAATADEVGLPLVDTLDPSRLLVSEQQCVTLLQRRGAEIPLRLIERDGAISFLVAAERFGILALKAKLRNRARLAARLRMVDPVKLRNALFAKAQPLLMRTAVFGLFDRLPDQSARFVANAWQGVVFGVLLTLLPIAAIVAWRETLTALHILATLFFFACVAIRLLAMAGRQPLSEAAPQPVFDDEMPVYSVLVALHREARIVPALIQRLDKLVWPRNRLEIRLVCEADDAETLDAIRDVGLPPHMEVVEVPRGGPTTKPKALSYALPSVGGEIVALYDAEDEPHPLQLMEAWRRFKASGPELAAVQAPLEISNREAGHISRLFAFEYSALFRGLLPWLARRRLVLPLGGTSNHFRRSALEDAGAWDPFNVTEDADLAIRLARFGYHTQMITLPTLEAAPRAFRVWLPQRTRWLKGWAQTWLVHMRDPRRLMRDLGPGSFAVTQILMMGMLASCLLHPLLLTTAVTLATCVATDGEVGVWRSLLLGMDVVNIVCGYGAFLLLGWQSLAKKERRGYWKVVLFTPVYWMMMSVAGWRAVLQLSSRPHHWEKTPH